MKFEEYRISPEIKQSLEELQFKRPTDIQFKAIPSILNGEDVLAIAQTGTGKTGAFAIPILHLLQEKKKKITKNIENFAENNNRNAAKKYAENISKTRIKCLVMVPTRELCIQIADVFQKLGKYTELNIFALYGGIEQTEQVLSLGEGIDVLVSTPGRMFSLQSQGHIDLDFVEILVLDEADLMLDLGFIRDIRDVIKLIPKKHQTLFFSATINKKIKELIDGVYSEKSDKGAGKDALRSADVEALSEKDLGKRIKQLEKQMLDHARNLEFEKAARARDQLALLREQAFGAPGNDNISVLVAKP